MKDYAQMLGVYAEALMADRFDVDMRKEDGALSLQWAAVGAFLIFIAIAVAAIMMSDWMTRLAAA